MRKKRESRLPFSRRPSAWPLASLVPRKHVPRTRAPPVTLWVLHTQRDLYERFSPATCASSHERPAARPLTRAPRSLRLLWPSATRALSRRVRSGPHLSTLSSALSLWPSVLRTLSKHERPAARPLTRAPRSLRVLWPSKLSFSAFSPPSFGRVQSAPPSAAPLRNRQRRKVHIYRTVTHVMWLNLELRIASTPQCPLKSTQGSIKASQRS